MNDYPPRRIQTTEPTADEAGVIHPAGTTARYYGKGSLGGYDFKVDGTDAILWSLMPVQYEVLDEVQL